MDLDNIFRIISFSDEEKEELIINQKEYEPLLEDLEKVVKEYNAVLGRKLKLDSKYASYNYKVYESFMETHKNAIILSGLFSEAKLKKLEVGKEAEQKINRILDGYLFLERFERG
ncbi:MAG: hypothetical protein M1148_02930 [Candidatus Thermoplasmatota archaeon]|jgi:hypothetical protein|nr:hypothetical protein [Candidatus Thermoplasmatota archaeon]